MSAPTDLMDPITSVAVIGMAGRFPGAWNVEEFWQNLRAGRRGIRPLERQEMLEAGVDESRIDTAGYVAARGALDGAGEFDAAFFNLSPREADLLDPQHRLFLQCAWHALEDAGCVAAAFPGRIGVFAGAAFNTYLLNNVMTRPDVIDSVGEYQTLLSSDKDFLTTRAAYQLGLTGPAVTVQTACSTSLSAVHLACQSLLAGECDIAIAGGVSVAAPALAGYQYESGGILSPDGHCRAFDERAQGTVPGNGVGIVVLRLLADAQTSGDRVDAVIRGSAWNNDGNEKVGYTAPGVSGQAEVIAEALDIAGVSAATIGYVEAHGTGTPMGDPIEVAALTQAFRRHTKNSQFCALGSLKASIGHLDAASGVAALIKTVLMLRHGELVPSADCVDPHSELQLDSTPFWVCPEARTWPRNGHQRRAGVSSFGIGGTNVHVVLEEAPSQSAVDREPGPVQLRLSAKTEQAVMTMSGTLADHLESHPLVDAHEVAATLAGRRAKLACRATVTGEVDDLPAALRGLRPSDVVPAERRAQGVAFIFPGQGSQYPGMAAALAATDPQFRQLLQRVLDALADAGVRDLARLLLTPEDGDDGLLRNTLLAQPALFAVEWALGHLLMDRGLQPAAMIGHSIGELVAVTLAGLWSLDEAARIVAARASLVAGQPAGAMVALVCDEVRAQHWVSDTVSVAAVNGPHSVVLSGPVQDVLRIEQEAVGAGLGAQRLHTSHAFHSPSMLPAAQGLAEVVATGSPRTLSLPVVSNVTGTWLTDVEASGSTYWSRHLLSTVRFADSAALLLEDDHLTFLEVGPGSTLSTLLESAAAWSPRRTTVQTLPRAAKRTSDDGLSVQRALGTMWALGLEVGDGNSADSSTPPVSLPGYPFRRDEHWLKPGRHSAVASRPGPWFSRDGWQRYEPPQTALGEDTTWLLLGDQADAHGLSTCLRSAGRDVRVIPAAPMAPSDWADVLADLSQNGTRPVHVVALAVGQQARMTDAAALEATLAGSFATLLSLAQALASAELPQVIVDVVTHGVHAVSGDEDLQPQNALLLGVVTVAPQEIEGVTARLLDALECPPEELMRILAGEVDHPVLAWRGRRWWRPVDETLQWQPLREHDPREPNLRPGGVYVLTGGLGEVALACAAEIAGLVEQPTLVLMGRSGVSTADPNQSRRRQQAVEGLIAAGATVDLRVLDVTKPQEVAEAFDAIRREHGPIRGVVHAAGAAASGPLAWVDLRDCAEVIRVKALGAQAVVAACATEGLDFLLLFSSSTAVLGGPGQSDYCAANAYLNSYAQAIVANTQLPASAVMWGTWENTGMARHGEPRRRRPGIDTWSASWTLRTDNSWIVADHRLAGVGLVPGTAYLDFISSQLARRFPQGSVSLTNVVFLEPAVVPDGTTCTITAEFTPAGAQSYDFSVSGALQGGTSRVHAIGGAAVLDPVDLAPVPVEEFLPHGAESETIDSEDRLRQRLGADRYMTGTGPLQFWYGPRWQIVRSIRTDGTRLVGTLELPPEMIDDLESFPMHPALVDCAGGIFRVHAPENDYLPLSYRAVRVHRALVPRVHCLVTITSPMTSDQETLECDILLVDDDGLVLVELEGFAVKAVSDVSGLMLRVQNAITVPSSEEGEVQQSSASLESAAMPAAVAALSHGMEPPVARRTFARLLTERRLPSVVAITPSELGGLRVLAQTITPALLEGELDSIMGVDERHARPDLAVPFVAPRTTIEESVAQTWSEVLGVVGVGVDDDFFALGGHSLAAVQVSSRLKQRFQVDLDLRQFFEASTVAQTADVIEKMLAAPKTSGADASIVPVEPLQTPVVASVVSLTDEELTDMSEAEIDALLAQLDATPEMDRIDD